MSAVGSAGTNGRGGGGGGGGADGSGVSSQGGVGGSGIVVVRYLVPAPTTPDLSAVNDSGALDTDNITSARTLTFTGTSAVGAAVQLEIATASSSTDTSATTGTWATTGSGCAADSSTGEWSCVTAELAAGAIYKVRANASATIDGTSDTQTSASALPVTIDTTAPTVAAFSSSTVDGSYKAGQSVTITATVSEAVQINNTITVTLETGSTDQTVTLTASAAGTTLTGTYTVQAGDTSSDLTVTSFTIGTVADTAGNAMTSTALPAGANVADTKAIVIDTTAPTVSSIARVGTATLKAGETVTVTFTFNESVTGFELSDVVRCPSGGTGTLSNLSGSGNSYTATFTPPANSQNGSARPKEGCIPLGTASALPLHVLFHSQPFCFLQPCSHTNYE
jgi:hypothetical protein